MDDFATAAPAPSKMSSRLPSRRPAGLRRRVPAGALSADRIAAALMAEGVLDPVPRPLDRLAFLGEFVVVEAPSPEWVSLLAWALRQLARRHLVTDAEEDDDGDGADQGHEDARGDVLLRHQAAPAWDRRRRFGPPAPAGEQAAEQPELRRSFPGGFTPPRVEAEPTAEVQGRLSRRPVLDELAATWRQGEAVVLVRPVGAAALPADLRPIVARTLVVPPPDPRLILDVAVLLEGERSRPGTARWRRVARRLGEVPGLPPGLVPAPNHLLYADRVGAGGRAWLTRLAAAIQAAAPAGGRGARLEELHGYGDARAWGLRLVADLGAWRRGQLPWSAVDPGVVLAGPPGTGKTTFAEALARSAGVPLVAASLASWQGAGEGHLGSTLAAMHASFARARALAPCVLLIDELDSLGSRGSFAAHHRDYSVQVVNALLEHLDGAAPREGVVVIGCTNDAARVDPAVLRPGRLDRVLHVPLPDAEALLGILRHHLGADLPDEDLPPLAWAAAARGASGADVAGWVRGARGRARHAGRALGRADLEAEIGPPPPPLGPDELWRVCVHEAGHALGYLLADRGRGLLHELKVPLGPLPRQAGAPLAYAAFRLEAMFPNAAALTPRRLRRWLRAVLGGRAAEAMLLGEASAGSGMSVGSDLAVATRTAALACGSWGIGGPGAPLMWHDVPADPAPLLAADPALRAAVEQLLGIAMADALRMADRCRTAIKVVADALATRGHLTGQEVRVLVRSPGRGVRPRVERRQGEAPIAGWGSTHADAPSAGAPAHSAPDEQPLRPGKTSIS